MRLNRRQMLRGAGGFTLAMPFLPSITNRTHAAPPGSPRRFIAMRTEHGALRAANMFPADSMTTEQQSIAGYSVRRGDLRPEVSGGTTSLSPVLTAPSTLLTPSVLSKMNVIRGLDAGFMMGHNRGGTLGNYGDNDGQQMPFHPTCDQTLAWSDKFYENLSGILLRTMVLGADRMSWGYANPQDPSSTVQPLESTYSSLQVFNQVFRPPSEPVETRAPIVDRVLADYRRLRDGNRRLSYRDRMRLDAHMSRVDEIERRINVISSCGDMPTPPDSRSLINQGETSFRDLGLQRMFWQLMNDVIAVALSCDTSRIVTMRLGAMWYDREVSWFSDYTGDWHQDIAHNPYTLATQDINVQMHRRAFENVFLDLANKLNDIDDPNGGKLLDSCALVWTQESGSVTHDPISMPIVMAGAANGWLRTGSYIDYTNRNIVCANGEETSYSGLLYHQFLGTMMQAMGLSPSDYEVVPGGGFGPHYRDVAGNSWWSGFGKTPEAVRRVAGQVLPFLRS